MGEGGGNKIATGKNLLFDLQLFANPLAPEAFNVSSTEYEVFSPGDGTTDDNYINNTDSNVTINGTENSNHIENSGSNVTINGNAGNDTITNSGSNVLIDAGTDYDSISNSGENVTISGDDGNDYIYTSGLNTSINSGAGNDTIHNGYGQDGATITGGTGDDYITSEGGQVLYTYAQGDGNDTIYGFDESSTLQITSGSVNRATVSGNNILLTVGQSTIALADAYGLDLNIIDANGRAISASITTAGTLIEGSDGDDYIELSGRVNATVRTYGGDDKVDASSSDNKKNYIELGDGNDVINNNGSYTTIDGGADNDNIYTGTNAISNSLVGGAGDDTISNNGDNSTVDGGAGNDNIENYGNNAIISAGTGNDYIQDWSGNSTILGGAGNDTINAESYNSLIDGGAGANVIQLNGDNSTVNVGEGNDNIYVSEGVYSLTVNDFGAGDAIILSEEIEKLETDSDGNIIAGNVTISGLNGTASSRSWSFKNNVATYSETSGDLNLSNDNRTIVYGTGRSTVGGNVLLEISGVNSLDGIEADFDSKVVTIYASSLSKNNVVTVSDGYTLALGNDVPEVEEYEEEGWRISGNVATYIKGSVAEGYVLEDNQIAYKSSTSDALTVTVNGVISTDGLNIDVDNKVITVSASSLSQDLTVTASGDYTLTLGENIPEVETYQENSWRLDGTTASYVSGTTTKGYFVEKNRIVYKTNTEGETLVTIEGVVSTDGLSLSGNVITISASSLGNDTVTVSDGYTLQLGSDVTRLTEEQTTGWIMNSSGAVYMNGTTRVGYELKDNQITYTSTGEDGAVVTVEGVTSTAGLSIDMTNKVVTVSAASLSEDKTVTVSDDYTLALGSDVTSTTETQPAGWKLSDGKATYSTTTTTSRYVARDNDIVYKTTSTENILATVEGVMSTEGLSIDETNKIVTVSAASLSEDSTVTVSDGYTLALGNDVTTAQIKGQPSWNMRGSNAYGTISFESAGYRLENNKISYVTTTTNNTVVVFGVASAENLKFDGTTVTVSKEALDNVESPVRVSTGYLLALADDVDRPFSEDGDWIYYDGVATYTSAERAAGYKIVNNIIIYLADKPSETITIEGLNGTDGIIFDDDTFIIPAARLQEKTVSITAGEDYYLTLADDVTKSVTTPTGWKFKDGIGTYSEKSVTAGYKVSNNEIIYEPEVGGNTLVEIEGVTSAEGLYIDTENKVVTVYVEALTGDDISITNGEYTLELADADDYVFKDESGWSLNSQIATYKDGVASAGYRLSRNSKSIYYTPEVAGTVKAELSGVISNPTFKTVDGEKTNIIQLTDDNFSDDGIAIISNNGEYQFELSGETADNKFTGSEDADTITNNGESFIIDGGAGNDYIYNNASYVSISGGTGNDRINNSGSSVSIISGKGNDNVSISGGEGNHNTFLYNMNSGKDKLFNLGRTDSIKIADSVAPDISANVQGKDIVFSIGNGKITVKDALNKTINMYDSEDNAIEAVSGNTYTESGVISKIEGDEQKILLASDLEGEYKADDLGFVDGSQLESGVSINAGEQGTSILGGIGKDTLISGSQDFIFEGGNGNDVFVYNGEANGRIADYSISGRKGRDKVSIDWDNLKEYDITTQNLILTFEGETEEKTLTIDKVKNTNITFLIPGTTKTKVSSFNDDAIFSSKGKLAEIGYNPNAERNNATFDGKNYSKAVTIDASNANYKINLVGNKKANLITAGSAGSTINGGRGKDTLVGGSGNDIFIYEKNSGNKVIRNYEYDASSGDVISLQSGVKITDIADKDGNRILSVGKDKITLEGGASLEAFKFDDGTEKIAKDGMLMTLVDGKENSVSLTSGFSSTDSIDFSETGNYADKDWVNLDASERKKGLTIAGDNVANSLIGSKGNDTIRGGGGNDFINGGAGNDELWGDDGANTFIFCVGDGTDTIKDFDASIDKILIQDTNGRAVNFKGKYNSSKDTLTLNVTGGGKVILTGLAENLTSDTTFDINGKNYSIKGKNLK